MRLGTFLPTYWTDYGTTNVATAVRETALAAASLGYASVWANDHVIAPATNPGMGHIIEPLTTLASIIHLAPGLGLGTSTLVLPQRNAIVVAKQAAALAVLSGGRFILGTGVGWQEEEFAILGADFAGRGAVADEAISAMRALWSEEAATFHGPSYNFDSAAFFPKPAGGRVPIWICGNTPPAIRRAARLGDGWDPFGLPLPAYRAGVAALRAQTERQGRPLPTLALHLQLRIGTLAGPAKPHLIGGIQEVAQVLRGYQEAGLEYLICDFVAAGLDDLLDQMRTMAEQIAPNLTRG